MKNLFNAKKARLILFTKYPVPGKTKTRLIPLLGPANAADLQKRLTEQIYDSAQYFALNRDIDIGVCFENGSKKKMETWLGPGPIYSHQVSGDIGVRMHHAILNAFESGCQRVVLIGSDIPDITETLFKQAFSILKEKDLVLGPSTDGGYWLIGLNKPADLFHDIEWSSSRVLEQTLRIARKQHLTYHLLDTLTDIDTENSLIKIMPEEAHRKPYISVIIPTLNESEDITIAIQSARHPDIEVIVVDGGSTDDTIEKALKNGAQVITGPRGRARQQNFGAKRALGKVLLFLHADTTLPENYISYVFETMMDSHVTAGAFKFKTDFPHPFMKLVEVGAYIRSKYFQLPYGDQALFLRKTLFETMGGFPDTVIAEDLFFVQTLSTLGKIRFVPTPVITSGRRWRMRGPVRTWLINTIILAGCKMGVSPKKLASLYKIP
ncbi:MAG: TIGR04283 family arsenosugar biosynthesis glycosyltransferase [Deltaproteobacteria bacterium]|nr:TIGR04283 family arsenosugar biosynthesis glycosyltransferase [Deltaproteobacteria bacterium]